MKFYLASGFQNKKAVNYVSGKLIEAGCVHTYDWTKNDRAMTLEELKVIGEAEKKRYWNLMLLLFYCLEGKEVILN